MCSAWRVLLTVSSFIVTKFIYSHHEFIYSCCELIYSHCYAFVITFMVCVWHISSRHWWNYNCLFPDLSKSVCMETTAHIKRHFYGEKRSTHPNMVLCGTKLSWYQTLYQYQCVCLLFFWSCHLGKWWQHFHLPRGVVPQSDLSPTIIVSRYYNDLNFFLRLTACSTKWP